MSIDLNEFQEKGIHFEGMGQDFFLIELLNQFNNSFQAKGDSFFEEISWKQCFLLNCIVLFEMPPTIKELTRLVGSSHQNIKQILLKLEKLGYVEITADSLDRRKQRITLTEKAEEFRKKYDQPSMDFMKKLYENIDTEALETTIKTILKLAGNLDKIEEER